MLASLRQSLIQSLWDTYRLHTPQMQSIQTKLRAKGITQLYLDHFAVIDLPSPQSGIPQLQSLFTLLGYRYINRDYLADKQNDFAWLCEENSENQLAKDCLPQVVVADFRLDELPLEIKKIIEKYSSKIPLPPNSLVNKCLENLNEANEQVLIHLLNTYFLGRDWPLPSIREFHAVQAFNELLAWVLVFGRRPNHFTLSVHLMNEFGNLNQFGEFIEQEVNLPLNRDGGNIKGGEHTGIAQGSTLGRTETVQLADGVVQIPTGFVEFVWRYPKSKDKPARHWNDYFTGFIAQHADRVIESLYTHSTP